MHEHSATPFDSVEGAHEYVTLLCATIVETSRDLEDDIRQATEEGATRRLDALRIVGYKIERLQQHLQASLQILNDLRTLRRLLLGERRPLALPQVEPDEPPPGV